MPEIDHRGAAERLAARIEKHSKTRENIERGGRVVTSTEAREIANRVAQRNVNK